MQESRRPRAIHGGSQGRHALHLAHVLAEMPDGDVAIDGDLPVVDRLLAHDQAKHGGLARAVRAHQSDFLATQKRRARIDEEDLRAMLLADVVESNHERCGMYYARSRLSTWQVGCHQPVEKSDGAC